VVCGSLAGCPPGWTTSSRPSLPAWAARGTSGPAWPPAPRGRPSLGAAVPGAHRILWRTTWQYRQRGWRRLLWAAGVVVANLLAVAAGPGGARVLLGLWTRRSPAWSASASQRSTRWCWWALRRPRSRSQPAGRRLCPSAQGRGRCHAGRAAIPPHRRPARRRAPSATAVGAWRNQATRLPAQPATRSRSVGDAGQAGAATATRSRR
jgi:hypothetical protein